MLIKNPKEFERVAREWAVRYAGAPKRNIGESSGGATASSIEAAEKDIKGASIELIDLRTIYPWDRQTVLESVSRTGRAIIVHESMVNFGVGAEVAATIQEGAFLHLNAPIKRIAGWTTHTGLAYEQFILPDVASESS